MIKSTLLTTSYIYRVPRLLHLFLFPSHSLHYRFTLLFCLVLLLITAGQYSIGPKAQKHIYFAIFTNNIWSYLLWPPVIVVAQIRGHKEAGSSPSSPLRFLPWKAFLSREGVGPLTPRPLASNYPYPHYYQKTLPTRA